jgi:subtilase family serine protease
MAMHAAPAAAQRRPDASDRVLPDYDRRASMAPVTPSADVQAAVERLRAARPNIAAKHNRDTGGVRTAFVPGGALSAPARGQARGIARAFLVSQADALGLEPSDLATLVPEREYVTAASGVRHVFWAQVVDGIPVFDATVSLHLAADGSVLRINSSAASARDRQRQILIDAADAVRRAAADIRPEAVVDGRVTRAATGNDRRMAFARGPFARDVEASLVWIPVAGRLRLAWRVLVEPEGLPQAYDVIVDAETGEIVLRQNRVKYAEGRGRVIQSAATASAESRRPDPQPFGNDGTAAGCPPISNHLVQDLAVPFRNPATVLDNTGRLSGNNAHVFRRANLVEGAMGTFDGTGWTFDFPFNSADAAETMLFFTTNFAHDFFYDLGFDEAAGNYQVDNFGLGGAGADPVRALARATGRNNATWMTAADGQSPTMSMFLWDGTGCWSQDVDADGTPDLDGDLDSDIVIHEYHHGVSLHLNPSFTGPEAGAMGEGGGDFFAYSVNNDTVLAAYSYPGGLRRVNGKTYGDWACLLGVFCEVHDNGEIWANVLWGVRERFRRDLVNGSPEAGIAESHRLYIDGLKLSPPAPSMLDMRDAMLQADAIRNPNGDRSGNFCRLWESFAARGMGVAALDSSHDPLRNVVADYSVPDGCTAPPSPPTVTIATLAATAYEAGTVPASVRIVRTDDTSSSLDIFLSYTGSATSADYLPLPSSVTIPAGESSAVLTITPVDDAVVELNETLKVTVLPSGSYVVGSPASATVSIVSDDVAADLQVSALTVPAAAAAGSAIAITDTTTNSGAGAAPETRTAFYLSTNYSIDAADVTLGTRVVPALAAAGGSSQAVTNATIPPGLTAGTYYVLARADNEFAVSESSEYNNTRSATLMVGPDLVVVSLSAPGTVAPGASVVVTDTTANQGASTADASSTRYYLSTNFSYDVNDVLVGARAVPALSAGGSQAGSATISIPAGTATGTYYLLVRADGGDAVTEARETNNVKWVQLQVGGDLVISALTGIARAAAGGTIAVTDTTRNQGAGDIGASTTAFYLSADYAFDASDVRLGARAVPALAGGASHSATTSLVLPASLAAGTWMVVAKADADAAVTETMEGNNTRSFSMQVGPDLRIASFSAPSSGTAGSTVTVSTTVTNGGAAPAGASRVRFYLSVDSRFDTSDLLLSGWRDVAALAPSASSAGSTAVTVPSLPAGRYYLFAVADADNAVPEALESNNTSIRFFDVIQ